MPTSPPRSSQRSSKDSGNVVAGLLFLLVAAVCAPFFLPDFIESCASLRWPSTPGTLSRVDLKSAGNPLYPNRFEPDVEYTYTVAGTPYTGSRLRVTVGYDQTANEVSRQLAGLRAGPGKTPVYYNPSNPAASLLRPGPGGSETVNSLFLLLLAAAGLLLLFRCGRPIPTRGAIIPATVTALIAIINLAGHFALKSPSALVTAIAFAVLTVLLLLRGRSRPTPP